MTIHSGVWINEVFMRYLDKSVSDKPGVTIIRDDIINNTLCLIGVHINQLPPS